MKDSTKRKLLGKTLYPIYRRMRFLSYKRKKLAKAKKLSISSEKKTKQAESLERKKQKKSFGYRIYRAYRILKYLSKRRKVVRKQQRERIKAKQEEKKQEKLEIKIRLKEKSAQDQILDKERLKDEKHEKKETKLEKKQLRKEKRKERFNAFKHDIKTFDRNTLKRWFSWIVYLAENKNERNNFMVISINSLTLFLLSYATIYIISQFITVWISLSFDYKTVFYYYKIYYNIESSQWSADSVKILFSIMPLTGLILGTIFIIIYSTFKNEAGSFKLFFLWGFVHGMVMFFGSLLMGTLLNKDFGWVIAYLYYRDTGKMIFSIISIFALISIGGFIAKSFIISGNTYLNYVDKGNRKFIMYSQVLVPAILGIILLALFKIPNDFYYITMDELFYEIMKLSTIILLIIPLIISINTINEIYFDEEPRKISIKWKYLLITVITFTAFRFIFGSGIPFGE